MGRRRRGRSTRGRLAIGQGNGEIKGAGRITTLNTNLNPEPNNPKPTTAVFLLWWLHKDRVVVGLGAGLCWCNGAVKSSEYFTKQAVTFLGLLALFSLVPFCML